MNESAIPFVINNMLLFLWEAARKHLTYSSCFVINQMQQCALQIHSIKLTEIPAKLKQSMWS